MALLQETKVSKPDVIKTVLPDPDKASNTNNVVNPTPDKQICIAKVTAPDIQQAKAQISVEVINRVLPDLAPLAELIAYSSRVREERITQAELPEVGKKAPGSSHIETARVQEKDTLEATRISAAATPVTEEISVSEAPHVPLITPVS